MHAHSLDAWRHDHVFLGEDHRRNERRTLIVVAITAAMMVAEIVAGTLFGSMALLADGWHMATHAGTLAISVIAYRYARHKADDPRFTFGTGKIGDLAGYTSAVMLGLVALLIAWESFGRMIDPVPIRFTDAAAVAVLGLAVNLACAWILRDEHDHHHGHGHDHHHDHASGHHHHARDNNLRAAYLHVLADALTSVAAILGLLAGAFFGWVWMDPLVGVLGAIVIARWSYGLMRDAGAVLTDRLPDRGLAASIRERLEAGSGDRVYDLHLWRVGPGHAAAVIGIVSDRPQAPEHYKEKLAALPGLSHVTVEVERCRHGHAAAPATS
ncbi:CDF family Co(II)/Ni(II) efflux transporter DmeF [Marinivivus vitaminiproducens]|uniref:CDF family Co(II)/Ni(II) efflux transporter DmeF n=1 Tax=Marinivivus vitaminiproducens TaxID=3035935 RepID=UPI0027AB4C58|nr:CDF family Co(II)/Ni(II) efflux transporter DmeF [Geminicoccaceae bacterium SCSIO 64248]